MHWSSILIIAVTALIYLLFLFWHSPLFSRRLAPGEAETLLGGKYHETEPRLRESLRAFADEDDGRPFYKVNLLQYREWALEKKMGSHPSVQEISTREQMRRTGREAALAYNRMVIPELLKRGSYPLIAIRKITNLITVAPDSDFSDGNFFEEVAIVRYRSRRDMIRMITAPRFIAGVDDKWASLEKTVAVPCSSMLVFDLGAIVPLLLVSIMAISLLFTSLF